MKHAVRRLGATGLAVAALGVLGAVGAPAAQAHPLGNATVNHYDGLTLLTDRVRDLAVVDTAEIPTLQRAPLIDVDGDRRITQAEAVTYGDAQCRTLADTVTLTVGGTRSAFAVEAARYTQTPGAAGLQVGRLECELSAPADLTRPSTVDLSDTFDAAGIGGWHEITAAGDGVVLHGSPVPAASVSDALRSYPNDLLTAPLDVRAVRLTTTAGAGSSTYADVAALPGADAAVRALNAVSNQFNALVGTRDLTVGVGVLAVLLAMALGAGHAFLPGHGKTIMAAYLVGKHGRLRDVVTVGATVTITHTLGVLAIGVLLSVSAALAPTAVEQALAVVSGLIVGGVGLWLLRSALRAGQAERAALAPRALVPSGAPAPQPADSGHEHGAGGGAQGYQHGHEQGDGHAHGYRHGHGHEHGHRFGRGGLVGLGVAGGLVPSPSALLVLLAAIALGRTLFGIVLVLGYGVGMALALSLAGLVLVRLQGRLATALERRSAVRLRRVLAHLPVLTALLVIVVGAGLVLHALSGTV